MSKKNSISRLALQLLPEDVASCQATQKVAAALGRIDKMLPFPFLISHPWFLARTPGHRYPPRGRVCRLPNAAQIRWKARWISFQEYSKAIGRPCGQLVGCSVFASSNNSHSIRCGSRGVFTLIAA